MWSLLQRCRRTYRRFLLALRILMRGDGDDNAKDEALSEKDSAGTQCFVLGVEV